MLISPSHPFTPKNIHTTHSTKQTVPLAKPFKTSLSTRGFIKMTFELSASEWTSGVGLSGGRGIAGARWWCREQCNDATPAHARCYVSVNRAARGPPMHYFIINTVAQSLHYNRGWTRGGRYETVGEGGELSNDWGFAVNTLIAVVGCLGYVLENIHWW